MDEKRCAGCGQAQPVHYHYCTRCGRILPNATEQNTPGPRSRKSGAAVPLAILLACAALFFTNQYTDLKPLDAIRAFLFQEKAQTVDGRYECRFSEKDMGGGVQRVDQTWAYVFSKDGTYTTWLNGAKQFSGTWSQEGSVLTIHIPAIRGMSAAYSSDAAVSSDGNSFTANGETYIHIG